MAEIKDLKPIDRRFMILAEKIAAGIVDTELDKKGRAYYEQLIDDLPKNGKCNCGRGGRLRNLKVRLARYLESLEPLCTKGILDVESPEPA